jgi:hypothetical protein
MASVHRLNPHDPLPESGRYLLVMRRFAEDAPDTVLTEVVVAPGDAPPFLTVPSASPDRPADYETAIAAAQAQAEREGFDRVVAVDRTGGEREQDILHHHGDHSVHMDRLVDDADPAGSTDRDPLASDERAAGGHDLRHAHASRATQGDTDRNESGG